MGLSSFVFGHLRQRKDLCAKLLRISLLCALRNFFFASELAFDARRSTQAWLHHLAPFHAVRYLFNMINYPPAKIIVKYFHLS